MLGGIAFQMVAITIYVALASEFLWRCYTNKPVRVISTPDDATVDSKEVPTAVTGPGAITRRLKLMIFGLVFSTLVIFIRSIYRTIELADGWTGRIITTQVYFSQSSLAYHDHFVMMNKLVDILDGAMIVLAMYTLNIFHPGFLLGRD
jgi:hypothetical protein